jgi:hypothetical protein
LYAHFITESVVHEGIFGSYMRPIDIEDSQGSYSHEYEFIGLHVNMRNVETESNGRRSKVDNVEIVETMRIL